MPANPYRITDESARKCVDAADYLFHATDWSKTTEGHDYWGTVFDGLKELVDV